MQKIFLASLIAALTITFVVSSTFAVQKEGASFSGAFVLWLKDEPTNNAVVYDVPSPISCLTYHPTDSIKSHCFL